MVIQRRPTAAGFSNQQALLVLLIAFPLGLIGLGIVLTILTKPASQSIAEAPNESSTQEPPASITYESEPEPLVPAIEPRAVRNKPLANQSAFRDPGGSSCWFQMQSGGELIGNRCTINSRLNVNGDRVFDVIEPSGLKRSIVLWDNEEAEVFLEGIRYTGTWWTDSDGDVRVTVGGGTFAFTPTS